MISDIEHLLMSIGHLYVLFGEVSIRVLCPFLSGVFFGVEFCKYFSNIGINPLSDVLVNMFYHCNPEKEEQSFRNHTT